MKMSLATVPTQINFASQSNSYWYINAMPYNRNRRIIRFQRISHAPTKIPICYRLIHLSTFIWIIIMIFWFGLGCGRILNYEICHFQSTIQSKQHNPLIGINLNSILTFRSQCETTYSPNLSLTYTTKRDESKHTHGLASTHLSIGNLRMLAHHCIYAIYTKLNGICEKIALNMDGVISKRWQPLLLL